MEIGSTSSSAPPQQPARPAVLVPSWKLHSDPASGAKYILYEVKVQNGNITTGVWRRYSDFISLRNWICFILGEKADARVPQLPPKKVVFLQSSAASLAASRAPLLAQFANRVIETLPRLCLFAEFRDFFTSDNDSSHSMRDFILSAHDSPAADVDDIDPLPASAPLDSIPKLISSANTPISVMISINAAAGSVVRLIAPVPIFSLAPAGAKDPVVSTELFMKDFESKPQAPVESDGAGASFCIGPFELNALHEKGLHVHIQPAKQGGSRSSAGHFVVIFWARMFAPENSGRVMSAIGYNVGLADNSPNVTANFIWWPAAKSPAPTPACAAMPSDTLTSSLLTQLSAVKKTPSSPLQRARSEIGSLQEQLADAERALMRHSARIEVLERVNAQSEEAIAAMTKTQAAKDETIEQLMSALAQAEASVRAEQTLLAEQAAAQAAKDALQDAFIKRLEDQLVRLNESTRATIEKYEAELAKMEAAVAALRSGGAEIESRHEKTIEEYESKLSALQSSMIEKYEAQLAALRSGNEQAVSHHKKMIADYESKLSELEASKSAMAKQHQIDFERWEASRAELIAANEAKVSDLELKQRGSAAQSLESHKKEVSELRETISVLQHQLDETREELSNLHESRDKEINAAMRRARASLAMENSQAALLASAQASFKRITASFSARSSASTTPLISPRRGDSLADALQKKLNALSGATTPSRRFSSTVIPPVSLSGLQTPSSGSNSAKPAMPTVDAISLEPLVAATTAAVSALATSSTSSRMGTLPLDFFLEDEYDDGGAPKPAPKDVEDIE